MKKLAFKLHNSNTNVQSTIEHTLPNTIERKHSIAKKTRISIEWPSKKTSYVLMSSNILTIKETIKWIATPVHFGITISTESGMVGNNRNSFKSRVHVV